MVGRVVAAVAVVTLVGGCAESASPRLTLAAKLADDDPDTHLTDLPRGQAGPEDGIVRVMAHGAVCSGVLVSTKVVLTAQHCVAGRDGAEVDSVIPAGWVWVELGAEPLPWGRVRARRISVCEGWDGGAAYDVAALVLEAPVPDVKPYPIGTIEEGQKAHAMGFGKGLVSRNIPQTQWHTIQSARGRRDGAAKIVAAEMIAFDMPTSMGDSGSPILNADGEVVAIASMGREGGDDGEALTLGARVDACSAMFTDLQIK